jgi:hypothetical protein
VETIPHLDSKHDTADRSRSMGVPDQIHQSIMLTDVNEGAVHAWKDDEYLIVQVEIYCDVPAGGSPTRADDIYTYSHGT